MRTRELRTATVPHDLRAFNPGRALGLFLWEQAQGTSLETARTMAVSTIVVAEMFYLVNSRFIVAPVLSRAGLAGNRMVWVALGACLLLQAAYVHLPPLQAVFDSTPLGPGEWIRVALAGLALFLVAELEKAVVRRLRREPAAGWPAPVA